MTERAAIDAVTGSSAMVLAAGLGRRMHPLTLDRPKPLVEVAGKCLIDYAFDHLRRAGIKRAVVNVHYLAEQLVRWAQAQKTPEIIVSDERRELLDTGGGIVKALPHLGRQPFFVLNSDSFWVDGKTPALQKLRLAWNASEMDCLLLLCPLAASVGYGGTGDFHMLSDGRLVRKEAGASAPFIYAGGFLVSPRLFTGAPQGAFSMNLLWDEAQAKGRLFGIPHDGLWIHVGTPESIAYAEKVMKKYRL
jgi:MurNAc alpha-1-phosphate uridylyltransferase